MKNICVFCSSSNSLDEKYYKLAVELGNIIVDNKFKLVYGGTTVGMMGELSKTVFNLGGEVVSVIPETIKNFGILNNNCTDIIVTKTMHERKKIMEDLADAFIALPGGFGTIEELIEAITLKQLNYHTKPIVILNSFDFYTPLLSYFGKFYNEKFAKVDFKTAYFVAQNIKEALNYIITYKFQSFSNKCSYY